MPCINDNKKNCDYIEEACAHSTETKCAVAWVILKFLTSMRRKFRGILLTSEI